MKKQDLAQRKADLLARRARLSVDKQARLAERLGGDTAGAPAAPAIPRRAESGPAPLSFGQQRLWFLDQWAPGSPFYNISAAVRLTGQLNVAALEQTLGEIVRRHEALRTTFAMVDGQAVQVISPPAATPLELIDLQDLPQAEREAAARQLAIQDAQRPFDLARGPLFRASLLKMAGGDQPEHILLLNMHHIVSDGWSMGVLVREVAALYPAFAAGQPSPLAELPIQYADFAVWQRAWLQGEVLEEQLAFWKRHLQGAPSALELPTDYPRPPAQTYRGAHYDWSLPRSLSEALQALSRQENTTLFMTLLAGFAALLQRYSGQSHLVVGTPIANRNRAEIEGLIGFFVNTLALHIDLTGDPTGRELLARVREVTLAAYAHQDLPFEMLVEELQPVRDPSHTPLFQVMFTLQSASAQRLDLPGLSLNLLPVESGIAKFNLTLFMIETEDGLRGSLEYNTDLFEVSTIARMAGHLQTLLKGLVTQPEQRLSRLPLVSEAEQRQVVVEWNATAADYPRETCVHTLFEAQVERTPDAIAVVFQDQHLSYRALNRRANQLAHYLQHLGVQPDDLVGVCLERSPEMIVSTLAALKAGGAYLPLDPAYPPERLAFMLQDTRSPLVVTQGHAAAGLPTQGVQVVDIAHPETSAVVAGQSVSNPASRAGARHMAYVMYTSGSTGIPKGIAIPHQAINRLVFNARYIELGPDDRVAQASTPSFDAATFEFWGAFLHGGCLVSISRDVTLSPSDLAAELDQQAISVLFLTTALFNQVARDAPGAFRSLRYLLFGGEAVAPHWVRQVLLHDPPRQLLHVYGPTESTTFASWYRVEEVAENAANVPIGYPIGNTQIYLLDRYGQPVPAGIPGELYIGGDGLARGYVARPDLTAQAFIPDPFSAEPGARLYRTGDLACYRPDGAIEFLGRIDHQAKVRGFRVEMGEIEAALSQHPAVREAVVLAPQDQFGAKRLVAYVVAGDGQAPAAGDLRRFLQSRLPDYMVPAAFVMLDRLPMTPTGKVDRQALPAPEASQLESGQAFAPPRTPVEQVLAGIWARVLGLERVGIYSNFFELGGHSLLATQVISRVRSTFQVELPLRSLFEAPTVAGLAERVETELRARHGVSAPPITPAARQASLPLSFAQQRLWFLDQWAPGSPFYNVPAAVRLTGQLNVAALEQTLGEIVRRHEALRTTFATVDGQAVQVISPAAAVPLELIDLEDLPEARREAAARQLALQDAQRPFDLARGPLFRASLLKMAGGDRPEHVLLLNMHHIVSDGWSLGVLVREVAALYPAFAAGQPSPLPELPIQYADFAVWQRAWLQGEVLEEQLAFWKRHLQGAPSALELPTDYPRPPAQTYRGAHYDWSLPRSLSEALQALSRQENMTLFMTLLAGFAALLQRYSGQSHLVVGTPIANRNRAEIEGLIGFFVNTLALHIDLTGDPTGRELLARVREVTLAAYAHQDLPFEMLVEELQPVRDPSRAPVFQVVFVLQNAPARPLELPGLSLGFVPVESGIAKFDLTLSVLEMEDGLRGSLEYNTDLFEVSTIARMAEHLQRLLEGLVAQPEQRLSRLPLMGEAEQRRVVVEWNATAADYPRETCVHTLFEAQVERTPDAIAVVFQDQHLSYRELNRRANQLAHHLQRLGVQPETLVGVCAERSPEMIVGLLGALKAGGAYLPLDPAYPPERLAFMLRDAQAQVLLTQWHLLTGLAVLPSLTKLCLDADWPRVARESEDNPASQATADNLAYTIYTSGSTGLPKGVSVQHRGLCNLAQAQIEAFDVYPDSRVLQFASFSFDASVSEVVKTLLAGATLCLAARSALLPGPDLVRLLQEQAITNVTFPPSVLTLLPPESLSALRVVVSAGEACSGHVAQRWAAGRHLINAYGPTETTVCATIARRVDGRTRPPIGYPIPNMQTYILDSHLQPVPVGVPGELYIGGDGLARGYLNRPDLTAECFIPNPFETLRVKDEGGTLRVKGQDATSFILHPSAFRLYKTGDLVRYRPDGQIEFLGRLDHQVKLRGFRIELGEIEAVLSQHPAVRETVVVAHQDKTDRRLVAYIVAAQPPAPEAGDLRRFLQNRLPDYMLPSAFVVLERLPLTPTGKVDRKALPPPDSARPSLAGALDAPRDTLELGLVHLWEDLLGVRPIGVRQNFFELGGHSLLAVRLAARIHQATGQQIPLAVLFQEATVEQLAAVLRRQREAAPFSSLLTLQAGAPGQRPLFLVHPAGGSALGYVALARHLGPDRPLYGLQARGLAEGLEAHTQIEAMAGDYIEQIQTVQPQGPYLLGGWSAGGVIAFEMAQQLEARGQTVALLALIDSFAPQVEPEAEPDDLALLASFALDLGLPLHRLTLEQERLERLAPDERLACVLETARQAGVVPPDLALSHVRRLFHVFKCNVLAARRYVPRAYAGPIVLFKANERPGEPALPDDLGWRVLAVGGLTVHEVPGNHYTIMREPGVARLAEQLAGYFARPIPALFRRVLEE